MRSFLGLGTLPEGTSYNGVLHIKLLVSKLYAKALQVSERYGKARSYHSVHISCACQGYIPNAALRILDSKLFAVTLLTLDVECIF